MRLAFACQWLMSRGSLAAVQEVLGRASIVTTQRYLRIMDEAAMREAQRISSRCSQVITSVG